jgi:hypothetical protein
MINKREISMPLSNWFKSITHILHVCRAKSKLEVILMVLISIPVIIEMI